MRKLERTYSGTERIIARARFSAWAFLREAFIAALLGGIIAVLWIFADDIEGALDPNFSGAARYLTPTNLKWVMVGAGGFVVLITLLHALSIYMQEIIVTEDKFLFRSGVGSTVNVMLPLNEIRYIDVRQNALQLLLGYGKIKVITDGEEPFVIRNLVRPERFARRIMRQCSYVREGAGTRLQLAVSGRRR